MHRRSRHVLYRSLPACFRYPIAHTHIHTVLYAFVRTLNTLRKLQCCRASRANTGSGVLVHRCHLNRRAVQQTSVVVRGFHASRSAGSTSKRHPVRVNLFVVALKRLSGSHRLVAELLAHYTARMEHLFNKAVARSAAMAARVESIGVSEFRYRCGMVDVLFGADVCARAHSLGQRCARFDRFRAQPLADGGDRS